MATVKEIHTVAIIGGGPAGLFMFQQLVSSGRKELYIHVFEKNEALGCGMPYSPAGANDEHITNVSDNEIPALPMSIADWVHVAPQELLAKYNIDPHRFNEYKVLPRLFFGAYLNAQFILLIEVAHQKGIITKIHYETEVIDIIDKPGYKRVTLQTGPAPLQQYSFHQVIICTGHRWPKKYEGRQQGWYDSPYPPAKLQLQLDHAVGLKGASLTAIDAVRTLARTNGVFSAAATGNITYMLNEKSKGFKMIMHSRNGLLPAVRFHLEDTHLNNDSLLSEEALKKHISKNGGFLSLDYIFEKDFKAVFRKKDPSLYKRIKALSIEEFVEMIMQHREDKDPFDLLKKEYAEAERSIRNEESVYWKEMLAVLSFAMNYPAKYLSAEDMLRLKKVLMPLISVVIAFVPQSSCKELMALHEAGVLELITAGQDSETVPHEKEGAVYSYTKRKKTHFKTFVDCTGQPHLSYDELPFKGLVTDKSVSPAILKFADPDKARTMQEDNKDIVSVKGTYALKVPGITIDDHFRIVNDYGESNSRIFMMAVPFIGGFNPDYSGLDFCEEASGRIGEVIFNS